MLRRVSFQPRWAAMSRSGSRLDVPQSHDIASQQLDSSAMGVSHGIVGGSTPLMSSGGSG